MVRLQGDRVLEGSILAFTSSSQRRKFFWLRCHGHLARSDVLSRFEVQLEVGSRFGIWADRKRFALGRPLISVLLHLVVVPVAGQLVRAVDPREFPVDAVIRTDQVLI